ncbi:MAG: hypothetical protein P8X46_11745, partial [Nitrospirales bacterium]
MDSTLLISLLVFVGMVVGFSKLFGVFRQGPTEEEILKQQLWIDTFRFPSSVANKVTETYPHLSPPQVESVLKGLREFFHICREAGPVMIAMPSQVVDVAWHDFILSTRTYQEFCQKAFGRYLHHTPAEAMKQTGKGQDGIKRAWRLACEREGLSPKNPSRLPFLFALDADLDIFNGFKYSVDCTKPGSHPYCGSHIGCSGASCGTSDSVSSSIFHSDSGGDSSGFGCGSSCGGGCG